MIPPLAFTTDANFYGALAAFGLFAGKFFLDEVRWRRQQKEKRDLKESEETKAKAELAEKNRLDKIAEWKRAQELIDREQTRLDLQAVATLNAEQISQILAGIQSVDSNGQNRLKVLLNSAVTTRGILKEYAKKADIAIETSNGIKTALMTDGVRLITDQPPTEQADENEPV